MYRLNLNPKALKYGQGIVVILLFQLTTKYTIFGNTHLIIAFVLSLYINLYNDPSYNASISQDAYFPFGPLFLAKQRLNKKPENELRKI